MFHLDESLYEREGRKRTELATRVFDHIDRKYRKGFRLLTLGWTDGRTFLPINFSLLSSPNEANILGASSPFDRRRLCHKRRMMARTKATEVMIELLRTDRRAGHKAKYVLTDIWFANLRQIVGIRSLGCHVIAMVKRSSKIRYRFEGQMRNIKEIYASRRKRRERSNLSTIELGFILAAFFQKYIASANVSTGDF